MKKIIASIKPFDMQQYLYVFEDGEKIDEATVSLSDVENTVLDFINKYQITDVDIAGPKQFNQKIGQELITKYSMVNINFV